MKLLLILLISVQCYARDTVYMNTIKPILSTRCGSCHNASWSDKNWLDYNTTLKNKEMIKLRLSNNTMPPNNVTDMTQTERKTIINWINNK